jgi:hypothetical protein
MIQARVHRQPACAAGDPPTGMESGGLTGKREVLPKGVRLQPAGLLHD